MAKKKPQRCTVLMNIEEGESHSERRNQRYHRKGNKWAGPCRMSRILMERDDLKCVGGREEAKRRRREGEKGLVWITGISFLFSSLSVWPGLNQKSFIQETLVCFLETETMPASLWLWGTPGGDPHFPTNLQSDQVQMSGILVPLCLSLYNPE